jgi:phage/plasmid-like protein (TIGR03299 family)
MTKSQGIMVGQPSWHRMEHAVLTTSPTTWEAARDESELRWEVTSEPVYMRGPRDNEIVMGPGLGLQRLHEVDGWQAISRDDLPMGDPGRLLAIQKDSYKIVYNRDFGDVIDTVLGRNKDDDSDPLNFSALFSLYGGRMIVALMYFPTPLKMGWDPSENLSYLSFQTRHDGNGGFHCLPTNVRTVCANTIKWGEVMDTRGFGFTIRHTSNFEERLHEVQQSIVVARGDSQKWIEFSEQLARYKVTSRQRDTFLKRWLPASDDMSTRQRDHIVKARDQVCTILRSETCEGISGSGYGLFQAATQYADHSRKVAGIDSYVTRQLTIKEPLKVSAAGILSNMAGIKR